MFQPWKLPDDWPKTEDMTDAELAEEARAQRHLLRASGFFDSAMFHPQLMNQQYLTGMSIQWRDTHQAVFAIIRISLSVAIAIWHCVCG